MRTRFSRKTALGIKPNWKYEVTKMRQPSTTSSEGGRTSSLSSEVVKLSERPSLGLPPDTECPESAPGELPGARPSRLRAAGGPGFTKPPSRAPLPPPSCTVAGTGRRRNCRSTSLSPRRGNPHSAVAWGPASLQASQGGVPLLWTHLERSRRQRRQATVPRRLTGAAAAVSWGGGGSICWCFARSTICEGSGSVLELQAGTKR